MISLQVPDSFLSVRSYGSEVMNGLPIRQTERLMGAEREPDLGHCEP